MNFEMAIENNLDIKDLTVISLLDSVANEKGSYTFEYSLTEIIKNLPLIFDSKSIEANSVRLRRVLDKEGMQKFITRTGEHKGRGKGVILTFKLNPYMIEKLDIKGIIA